jgi:cytochrome P450 PksS
MKVDVSTAEHKANPFPTYARLRAEAPVLRVIAGDRKPAWLVSRYGDVAAALKDPRLGKDPFRVLGPEDQAKKLPWMPGFVRPMMQNMLDQDPPNHTRLRGLVQQAFTPRRVEELRRRIETITEELVARARQKGAIDLLDELALPLPMAVISEMLGVDEADRPRFRAWTNHLVSVVSPVSMIFALPSIWMFMRYLRKVIEKRRREADRDDLIASLLRAEESGKGLSDDELVAMIVLLITAGHETTVNLIASGTLGLLDQPEALEHLRREPDVVKSAVEELLRFTSPVDLATERYSREEIAFGEHVIPRGERVFAVLGSANHDEHVFATPERLVLDREPNKHLAFGNGPHYCLGAPLARLEAQMAFGAIARDLPGLRLAVPRDSLRWKPSQILRGLTRLPVKCDAARIYSAPQRPEPPGADARA